MRRVFLVLIFRRTEEIWACCLFSGKHAGRRMSAETVSAKPRGSGTAIAAERPRENAEEIDGRVPRPIGRNKKGIIFIYRGRGKCREIFLPVQRGGAKNFPL